MFNNQFEVFLADTLISKEIQYSIRYQVFCEEMKLKKKEHYPDKMEYDENDKNSVHFLVYDNLSRKWVGAMRLIYKRDVLLPIEQSCKISEKIACSELYSTVEMSRLCLSKDIRRGIIDIDPPCGLVEDSNYSIETDKVKLFNNQHKVTRSIIWKLFQAASEYGQKNNISDCYFFTTLALAKLLRRGGLNLVSVGESCQHEVERFPFRINAVEAYRNIVLQRKQPKTENSNRENYNGYRFFSELSEVESA